MELVCTIGPASSNIMLLESMKVAGMTRCRQNQKHATREWHESTFEKVLKLELPYLFDVTQGREFEDGEFISKMVGNKAEFAFALPFVESSRQFLDFKTAFSRPVWAKIENKAGLDNAEEICDVADAILLDRKDFRSSTGGSQTAIAQFILSGYKMLTGVPYYIASGVFESMATSLSPSLAEVHDVYASVIEGVTGMVLAEETAIGLYPVEATQELSFALEGAWENKYSAIESAWTEEWETD